MNTKNLKNTLSIVAALASAIAVFYAFLAPVWGLPFADKISTTAGGFTWFLSLVLGAFTAQKVVSNYGTGNSDPLRGPQGADGAVGPMGPGGGTVYVMPTKIPSNLTPESATAVATALASTPLVPTRTYSNGQLMSDEKAVVTPPVS